MSLEFLRAVVVVEIVIIVWLLVAQAVYALVNARRRRFVPLIEAARNALFSAVVTDRVDEGVIDALRELPPRERDEVLCGVALGVQSHRDPVFRQIATEVGTDTAIDRDLGDRRWWIRQAALRRLLVLGMARPGAPPLLLDPDPRVRAIAAEWIALVDPSAATATLLVAMLADEDDRVQQSVMTALHAVGSSAQSALVVGLGRQTGALRGVLTVVAAVQDPVVAAAARPLLEHEDPAIVSLALQAVRPVLSVDDVGLIHSLLTHEDLHVRRAAAEAAGGAGLRELVGLVAGNLSASDGGIREAAIGALERLGPTGELLLRRAARPVEVAHG